MSAHDEVRVVGRHDKCLLSEADHWNEGYAAGRADLLVNDLRSSALLVFLRYIEEKRRLRPADAVFDAGYLDAIYEVRRYVTELVEPEQPKPREDWWNVLPDGTHKVST